jgi:enoyl-CoA hydratase/carnithine racemase
MSTDQPILLRADDPGVTTLTLNRPGQYNALSDAMIDALGRELEDIAADESIQVVVLTGNGRGFCAGHDLKEMTPPQEEARYLDLFQRCNRMMMTITQMPQVVIARVQGIATAAGCQLVASCDLAVAALFCSTPAVPVSRNLPRKKAFELLITGEFIDAGTALEWGLVNRVAPDDELDAALGELLAAITSKSSLALRTGKGMLYRQLEMDMEDAYRYAAGVIAGNMMAEDVREGIAAFTQKRAPVWKGR